MNAGEIGKEAGRIFEYKLPANWIARSQEDQDDHGIDYEIEIKNSEGKALGEDSLFKIQVKGEENCSFLRDGQTVSHSIKVDRLNYYLSFNIPVVLIVVDVTLERVFWISITDSERVKEQVANTNDESKSVHLPVENELIRRNNESFSNLLEAVKQCWDYLSVRGIKKAVKNYSIVKPAEIDKCIDLIGDAFFKAHHEKLNQLLLQKDFPTLYEKAGQLAQSSIAPAKDRFIAVMYYAEAFNISPYKVIKHEQVMERLCIREWLVRIAREKRDKIYRTTAIGKARIELFKVKLDNLHAMHISNYHFDKNSFEYLSMNRETSKLYMEVCGYLEKLIHLCNRLTKQSQFDVLASLFVELAPLVLIFKSVHSSRGADEPIAFLDSWYSQIYELVLSYVSLCSDLHKLERLYFLSAHEALKDRSKLDSARKVVLKLCPESEQMLNLIESKVNELNLANDFNDLSVEKQKEFFVDMAKNLGMDPDDPKSEFGQFIRMGLENYDPTDVIKNCEHMFVHYKPAGLIAQQLGMHSLGMSLMVCLKHHHVAGTGRTLIQTYDRAGVHEGLQGFKQRYCDDCNDCTARPNDWEWSLRWQLEKDNKHKDLLKKYMLF
jgi:hypothetical protein